MNSPFHSVMTTPVLDVRELARLMRHHSGRADRGAEAGCGDEEEDAVLLGKLLILDELAERMWSVELSGSETADLQASAHELGRAVEVLTARMVASVREKPDGSESHPCLCSSGSQLSTVDSQLP